MRLRLLLVLVCALGGVGSLAFAAFVSPEIAFLRPSSNGSWIVHPAPPIRFHVRSGHPVSPAMIFRHRFRAAPGVSLPVRVTALQRFTLTLNGVELRYRPPRSWKQSTSFELAPYLRAAGDNELSLEVFNLRGPPALLVEGPAAVRSGVGWTVYLGPGLARESAAVPALAGEWYMADHPNPLRRSPRFPVFLAVLILLLAFAGAAAIPWRRGPWLSAGEPRRHFFLRHGICLLLLAIAAVWQVHNAWMFKYRNCDFRGHVGYIWTIANSIDAGAWKIPSPDDGWETYQPPLYYISSAIVYRLLREGTDVSGILRGLRVASALFCLLLPLFAWLTLCRFFPAAQRARNLGLACVALLPMALIHSPIISNEGFAAVLIGGTILFTFRLARREQITWGETALLGVACAAGLLAKYTGLFVFVSVLLALCLRREKRGEGARLRAVVVAGVTLALAGWYYARNALLFGHVFLAPHMLPRMAFYQVPGYRDLSFFTRFGPFLFQEPQTAAFTSFWGGVYTSLWGDGQSCGFLDPGSEREGRLEALILWLALVPAAAIVLGFGRAVRRLIVEGFDHPFLVPVLTSVTTLGAVVFFALEEPVFSAVKGWYLWSLLVPAALYAGLGFEWMSHQLGRLRLLLDVHLILLSVLILSLYWYRGSP